MPLVVKVVDVPDEKQFQKKIKCKGHYSNYECSKEDALGRIKYKEAY